MLGGEVKGETKNILVHIDFHFPQENSWYL
jgi:hypothetical protein